MEARTDSRRRLVIAIAMFLLVSAFVVRTSDAAFTDTYTNLDNEFVTATISLDSATVVPLFGDAFAATDPALVHALDLYPGVELTECIDIEYAGPLDAADLDEVTFDVAIGNDDGLAEHLTVTVDALDGDCLTGGNPQIVASDALDNIGAGNATGWTPATDGDTIGFDFTVVVEDTAEMGGSVDSVDLTWTLQTTS